MEKNDLPLATLVRTASSDHGTRGTLRLPTGHEFFTLELPWRDNEKSFSCILPGEYITKIRQSPRFGKIYHVTETPGRDFVLVHNGNFAGDTRKGYKSHVEGCILVGKARGVIQGQEAVLNSKQALYEFMKIMGGNPFLLAVIDNTR